jgi:hypothetical protein
MPVAISDHVLGEHLGVVILLSLGSPLANAEVV